MRSIYSKTACTFSLVIFLFGCSGSNSNETGSQGATNVPTDNTESPANPDSSEIPESRAMDIGQVHGKQLIVWVGNSSEGGEDITNLSRVIFLNVDGTVSMPNNPLFDNGTYMWEVLDNGGEFVTNSNNELTTVAAARFSATLNFLADPDFGAEQSRTIVLNADINHSDEDDVYLRGERSFMSGQVSGDIILGMTDWNATITPILPFVLFGFDSLDDSVDLNFYLQSYNAEEELGYVNLGEYSVGDDGSLDLTQILDDSTFNYYLVAAQVYSEVRGIRAWGNSFATFPENFIEFENGIGYGGNTDAASILLDPSDPFFNIYGKFGFPGARVLGQFVDTGEFSYTERYLAYVGIKR